jgi:hypothetical protein
MINWKKKVKAPIAEVSEISATKEDEEVLSLASILLVVIAISCSNPSMSVSAETRINDQNTAKGNEPENTGKAPESRKPQKAESTGKQRRKEQVENEEGVEPVDTNQGDTNQGREGAVGGEVGSKTAKCIQL